MLPAGRSILRAEDLLDRLQQGDRAERLREVVVGPSRDRRGPALLAGRRHHDHPNVGGRGVPLHRREHVRTGRPGDAHVQEHQVGAIALHHGERLITIGRLLDLEPLPLQDQSHRLSHRGVVLDDQDPGAHDARILSANTAARNGWRSSDPSPVPIFRSSSINGTFVCSRPAVSTISTSDPRAVADVTASKTTAPGSAPRSCDTRWAPARTAHTSSCSPAAARKVSAPARLTRRPSPARRRASFPIVVVLPVPFTPTTRTTPSPSAGSARLVSGPRIPTISSRRSSSASAPALHRSSTAATNASAAAGPTSAFRRVSWSAIHASSPASRPSTARTRAPSPSRRTAGGAVAGSPSTDGAGGATVPRLAFVSRTNTNPTASATNSSAMAISTRRTLADPLGLRHRDELGGRLPGVGLDHRLDALAQHPGRAVLVQRDAVHHRGDLHRPLLMRDDHHLRLAREAGDEAEEPLQVQVVERRLHLVHQVER